jgi:hypothetical protein
MEDNPQGTLGKVNAFEFLKLNNKKIIIPTKLLELHKGPKKGRFAFIICPHLLDVSQI